MYVAVVTDASATHCVFYTPDSVYLEFPFDCKRCGSNSNVIYVYSLNYSDTEENTTHR